MRDGWRRRLDWAVENGHDGVRVFSDSQLLVRQLKGIYKVKSPGLRPLFRRCKELAARIPAFEITHVPREENRDADALANRAMDEESGNVSSPLPV